MGLSEEILKAVKLGVSVKFSQSPLGDTRVTLERGRYGVSVDVTHLSITSTQLDMLGFAVQEGVERLGRLLSVTRS